MKRFVYIIVAAAVAAFVMIGAGCSSSHREHEYKNGVCSVCGTACVHSEYTDGVCDECGEKCSHIAYVNGVCAECGSACTHFYANGVCFECGVECNHMYTSGVCTVCGKTCDHNYVGGVCTVCMYECPHEVYEQRVCVGCGEVKPSHYDYVPHTAERLPRIDIVTVSAGDGPKLMNTDSLGFDMNDLSSKDNRPYYDCTVSVSNCESAFELDGITASVKVRGNYTANYPKKPFRIKFVKKQGMLGLNDGAKLKNWVLLADYKDISMTRNTLAFYLGNMIFGSDDYYCTDYRPVELYLNNNYWGMYLLAEHQQVNSSRVDVTEPEDGYTGTDIGYMLEYDGYYNFESAAERFTCNYNDHAPLKVRDGWTVWPSQDGFTIKNDVYYTDVNDCAQTKFISSYINNLYKLCYEAVYSQKYYTFNADNTALVSYTPKTNNPVKETVERVVDIRSLVDAYIINELACDADIAWSSFCMRVDFGAGGDKRLRFEAPWDFDSAFGLKDSCASGTGLFAADQNNPWLTVFINEPWFWNEIKAKWREMQAANVMTKALEVIESGRALYAEDYEKNFGKWGFVKNSELNWQAMQLKNHAEAVKHLYDWFNTRVRYLDTLWK